MQATRTGYPAKGSLIGQGQPVSPVWLFDAAWTVEKRSSGGEQKTDLPALYGSRVTSQDKEAEETAPTQNADDCAHQSQ